MCVQEESGQKKKDHDYSFPKQARILRRSEFLYLGRRGKRYVTRFFIVHLYPNKKNRPRLGITVSKKIGNAVVRNQLKRRIREFFRLHQHGLPKSTDILIVARKASKELTYSMMCTDLTPLLVTAKEPLPSQKGDC